MTRFQNILETVGNTPVVRINRLAPEGVDSRILIDKLDGYEVWIDAEQLYYIQQLR